MKRKSVFILKGNIVYSKNQKEFSICENGYVVCKDGIVEGVYKTLPFKFGGNPIRDYKDALIIPGFTDLHVHAPQYSYRGLGMDMELLEWLETNTFPEESKFCDLDYAEKSYRIFVKNMQKSATTRACVFATLHRPATVLLMDMLEQSGLSTFVGKVNMDRNAPDYLVEETKKSTEETLKWIEETIQKNYSRTYPILTPRFIPTCTDEVMKELKKLQETL